MKLRQALEETKGPDHWNKEDKDGVTNAEKHLDRHHEREAAMAGARFHNHGRSKDVMDTYAHIGSTTSKGQVTTHLDYKTGKISHQWD